jgi:hypothetical protein
MTSEEEVERQIRRALMVRAARIHPRTDGEWDEPVAYSPWVRCPPPGRRRPRRPWELAVVPALAALVAAIVLVGTAPDHISQTVGVPSSAPSIAVVVRGTATPPARRAAGGVVLTGQDHGPQPAGADRADTDPPRACDLGVGSAMVHGLRSPNCLD